MNKTPERYAASTKTWAAKFTFCWRCRRRGVWPNSLAIHHIVRGSSRQKNNLSTTAICCHKCHNDEHHTDSLGMLGWLLLKRHFDKDWFSLPEIASARGRALTSITEEDLNCEEARLVAECRLPYTITQSSGVPGDGCGQDGREGDEPRRQEETPAVMDAAGSRTPSS